jgi:DNA polymerase
MAHPAIVSFWNDLEAAAISAVETRKLVALGKLAFKVNGSFLFLRLPSGRALCYPYPRVEDVPTPWGAKKPAVVFKGVDTYTRKWGDRKTYGGLWAENVTQAVARDVLAEAIVRVEGAGYPVILHVHDEIVSETKEGFGSEEEFAELMSVPPAWAVGFPIAVEGWRGRRYRK